jgi:hypothetical protein
MAQNTTIALPPGSWVLLTDADVSAATFQNLGTLDVLIAGTADATAPSTTDGALRYPGGTGERNADLGDLFPGISAARLWGYAPAGGSVTISHA